MTSSVPLTFTALALFTTLAMSGCSSQSADPETSPAPAASSPSQAEPDSSAPVVPAGWQAADLKDVAELSAPPEWVIKSQSDSVHTLEAPKEVQGLAPGWATVGVGNLSGGDAKEAFDWTVKRDMETNYAEYTNLKRLPDEIINGTTFYRLQFETSSDWYDMYGTVTPDGEYRISIEWKFLKTLSRKQTEAIWRPVMPTFKML